MKSKFLFRSLSLSLLWAVCCILPSFGQNDIKLLTKPNLKVLDLGNSYTDNVTTYLSSIVNRTGADVSNMCLYKVILPNSRYRDWYYLLTGTLSNGTNYIISKVFGGLTVDTPTGKFDVSDNTTILNLLQNNDWDLIIIHQQSGQAPYYDNWTGNEIGGWLTEFVSILREYQPEAALGTYLIHSYSDNYSGNNEKSSLLRWQLIANSVKRMTEDYDISFVLPYGTAIENLRRSSFNNETELTTEGVHLANGFPSYAASCCYYEALVGARTGVSMETIVESYLPTVNESSNNAISVTKENAAIAQEAVRLALNDWYNCINPENPSDVADRFIVFQDDEVKRICISNWDFNEDGMISETEAAEVTSLNSMFTGNTTIKKFNELSYFTGLEQLEEGAFNSCTSLTEITLPSSLISIGENAFSSSPLTDVTCFMDQPFEINENVFSTSTYSNATLKIPSGSTSLYSSTSAWNLFSNVAEPQEQTLSLTELPSFTYGDEYYSLPKKTTEGLLLTWTSDNTDVANVDGNTLIINGSGNANITAIQEGNIDYCSFEKVFSLSVSKAELTITAVNSEKYQGEENPEFSVTYEGFVNNDDVSCLINLPVVTTTAISTSEVGDYPITVSGADALNYEISYVDGILTVLPVPVPTHVSIVIGEAGIATYCSEYDLDFSNITDIKAFIAVGFLTSSNKVLLVNVKDIPAYTGAILRGEAGQYEVPVEKSSSFLTNLLEGTTTPVLLSPTIEKDGILYTNFVLSNNNGNIGFYSILHDFNLGPNKAYLPLPSFIFDDNANMLNIEFEDEIDGIANLENKEADGAWFTLSGIRVEQPTRGMYINNGRKKMVK